MHDCPSKEVGLLLLLKRMIFFAAIQFAKESLHKTRTA